VFSRIAVVNGDEPAVRHIRALHEERALPLCASHAHASGVGWEFVADGPTFQRRPGPALTASSDGQKGPT
jgi:hypothetical protein